MTPRRPSDASRHGSGLRRLKGFSRSRNLTSTLLWKTHITLLVSFVSDLARTQVKGIQKFRRILLSNMEETVVALAFPVLPATAIDD